MWAMSSTSSTSIVERDTIQGTLKRASGEKAMQRT